VTKATPQHTPAPTDGNAVFPYALRVPCVLLSVVVAISAVAGLVIAIRQGPPILVGFEAIVLLATIFSAFIGLGKFREAPAMGILIAGTAIFTGAILGETDVFLVLRGIGRGAATSGVDILPYAIVRLCIGLVFIAMGGMIVLLQKPGRSFALLFRGILLAIPIAAIGVALSWGPTRSVIFGLNGYILAGLALIAIFIFGGFLAASGHWIIRAFEAGLPDISDEKSA